MTKVEDIKKFYNSIESNQEHELNGWSRPEHNSLVNDYIKDYVEKCLKRNPVQLVDIGCGTGMLGDVLESNFDKERFRYVGVDLNEKFYDYNLKKGRTIFLRNVLTDNFQFEPGFIPPPLEHVKTICVMSGIFAIFPKEEVNRVLTKAISWYDTTMCYAIDAHLCDYLEENRHNYIDFNLLNYLKTLNPKRIIKTSFPEVYHSVLVFEK